jgi:2',3'-cyclic-nucleotide 2'-phosphodiesterase (5'-nucleotidase family)
MKMGNKQVLITLISALITLSSLPVHAQSRAGVKLLSAYRTEMDATMDTLPAMTRANEVLQPFRSKVDSVRKPVLGVSDIYMEAERPESPLSNFLADLYLAQAPKYKQKKVDLAILNMGGIRNAMPKGDVTYGDVQDISPFNNHYCVVTLRGKDLLSLFREMAKNGGEAVSGNVRMVITPEGKLLKATLNGEPINEKRKYRIATIDYLSEGNDGMVSFKKAVKVKQTDVLARDVIVDYLKSEHTAGRTVTAKKDGRVRVAVRMQKVNE